MATVKFISSSLVQASNPKNPNHPKIDLTPWDLQLLPYGPIQKGLLFPIPKNQEKSQIIQHLKSSLSHTLNFFPPLSGRLAMEHGNNDTTCFYVDCNNKGALFIHAVADKTTIGDIIEPKYVPVSVHSFFHPNGIKNIEGTSNPVLAVQVTELVNGVFVGCTINHTICDGKSFWHFFNSWSEISRNGNNSDTLPKPPVLQRWFPENFNCPILIPNSFIKQIHDLDVLMMTSRPMRDRVLHFSKEKIGKLKAKVNAEVLTSHKNIMISSLQSVLATIWVSVIAVSKNLDPDDEINYRLPVGVRKRVDDSVCEEYFGNAVQGGIVVAKVRDLIERGIGNAALEINKMVAAHDEREMREFFELWARSPRMIRGSKCARSVMSTSCSPRFDVYGNDFGWGKPIAARSGVSNKGPGLLTVYCGVEDGSIDVEACLSPEVWEALEENEVWLMYL